MQDQSPTQESLRKGAANNNKRYLIIRFCLAAIIVTTMLVVALTAAAYLQTRQQVLQTNLEAAVENIDSRLQPPPQSLEQISSNTYRSKWVSILLLPDNISLSVFNLQRQLVWKSSGARGAFSEKESKVLQSFLASSESSLIVDPHTPRIDSLLGFFGNKDQAIPGLVKLYDEHQQVIGIIRLVRNYDYSIEGAQRSARRSFWYILAGNLLLFFTLFYNFQLGLQTIESQEKTLSQQVSRLSNLLSVNKNMQRSMKTASSRAVEMNEQFLRRVGSDLHDGPAQLLGYAIMRLNKIAEQEEAKNLSHEFHVVRDALDSSIDEIRDISSGLVLPELEQLTLEESLHRVVKRHAQNSDTEVSEYYSDLPDDIALPIKITAYRFVQEGLNNAHRHGQAGRCRVTALVKKDVLYLSLKDNGMGFRKSQLTTDGGHLGLLGLKDRIESLGGRFNINSELGVGTAIKVSISLSEEAVLI